MLKALIEKRGMLMNELDGMLTSAKEEERAFTTEEASKFDELTGKIDAIDTQIKAEQEIESRSFSEMELRADEEETEEEDNSMEMRSGTEVVADFVRGNELRAGEMTTTSTGRIIPADFSSDIIRKATTLADIVGKVSIINNKGDYKQIVAANEDGSVTKVGAGWTAEIGEITASSAAFSTITIGHHKLGSLVKLSLELINQNEFDIASEIQGQMIEAFAEKVEAAVLMGTGKSKGGLSEDDMPYGLVTGGTAYSLATAALTADDIVKIFHTLKAPYQNGAAWIMSNDTLCKIRLLKDANGQYLFHQSEMTNGYVGTILGKPVYLSDMMDNIEAGKTPIFYGDFASGYKANVSPEMSMQVLTEKYAEYGMVGILGIMWLDGKPVNNEAYVKVSVANG